MKKPVFGSRVSALLFVLAFCLSALCLALLPAPAQAAPPVYANTLGVQAFLDTHPGVLKSYTDNDQTAAAIIESNSLYYGLSPHLLLALLETTSSLLSDSNPPPAALTHPFSTAGPPGFAAQIEWASRELRAGLGPYDQPPTLRFADDTTLTLTLDQAPEGVAVQRFLAHGRTQDDWHALNARFVQVFADYFHNQLPDLFSAPSLAPFPPDPSDPSDPPTAPDQPADPPDSPTLPGEPAPPDDDVTPSDVWEPLEGFLHLPWERGVRVEHLAYFDHVYPTVDSGGDGNNEVITYLGERSVQYNTHDGHDYYFPDQPIGTKILAAAPGIAYASTRRGNGVVILHANGYETVYWHLDQFAARFDGLIDVPQGVWVSTGDFLGTSGDTGCVNGCTPHLHFEVRVHGRQIDPYGWYGGGPDPCTGFAGCAPGKWLWHDSLRGLYDFTPPDQPHSRYVPGTGTAGAPSSHPDGKTPCVLCGADGTVAQQENADAPDPAADTSAATQRDSTPPLATLSVNPPEDLLLQVRFDGHALQEVGSGFPTTTGNVRYQEGHYHQSMLLDEQGSLTYPVSPNISLKAGTISLWAYVPASFPTNSINRHYLFAASAAPNDAHGIYTGTLALRRDLLGEDGSARWAFWTTADNGEAGRHDLAFPDRLWEGWHHFAVTWEASSGSKTLYLDGLPVAATEGVSLPTSVGHALQIGRFTYESPRNGMPMDDLAIFNRALSAEEIARIAQSSTPITTSTTRVVTPTINLDTNALDEGGSIVSVQLGRDGTFYDPHPYYDNFAWELPAAEGVYMVEARYTDRAGNQTYTHRAIEVDQPPRGQAFFARRTLLTATVAISVTDWHQPITMQIGPEPTFASGVWLPVQPLVEWHWRELLDLAHPTGGVRHNEVPLYVRFRDAHGLVSQPVRVQEPPPATDNRVIYLPLVRK